MSPFSAPEDRRSSRLGRQLEHIMSGLSTGAIGDPMRDLNPGLRRLSGGNSCVWAFVLGKGVVKHAKKAQRQ